jgi:hypothetical protein
MIPTWANAVIDETTGGTQLMGDAGQRWYVQDTEQGIVGPERPAAFIGTYSSLVNADVQTWTIDDLCLVECAPNAGESIDAMRGRFAAYIAGLRKVTVAEVGAIPYIRTNYVLSEIDIANGLIACSELGVPCVIFEWNRPDIPTWAADWLTYWKNSQPCAAQAKPPTQQNAALKRRSSMSAVATSAVGFDKAQLITIDGNRQGIKVYNPLPVSYDGLPPAGTLLPGSEDGNLPDQWVVLTIDPHGNISCRKLNRPGGYGSWQYLTVLPGMIAFHPDDQHQVGAAFFFLCA